VQDSRGAATEANFDNFQMLVCFNARLENALACACLQAGYSRKGNTLKEGQALCLSFLFGSTPHLPVSRHRQTVPAIKSKYLTIETAGPNTTTTKNVGLIQFIISTVLYTCESCVDELLHGDFEQDILALQIHWNENYGQLAMGRQFLKNKHTE
jgi:hypothetical protein